MYFDGERFRSVTQPVSSAPRIGNLLCLDFVNTEVMSSGARADLVTDFAALARWAREAGILSDAEERAVVRASGRGPQAIAALEAARALRTALRGMAGDLANGKAPSPGAVAAVNAVLASGASVLQIERRSGAFTTRRQLVTTDAASLLVPVAESAAWLLEHGDSSFVRGCENPACILFFYDTTKNKRRRWCSMEGCGSRAKAAAYYRRTRGKAALTVRP
jgi:predicted RNA-binding Zn ribbon-like protein